MRLSWVRRRWRWLGTLLLLLVVGGVWVVIIRRPAEPFGRIVIERQQDSDELFYVYAFDSQQLTVIPYNGATHIDVAYQMSRSADGERVAFIGADRNAYRIYAADHALTNAYPITSGPRDFQPMIAPDGRTVVFERLNGNFSALFSANVASGVEHQLTEFSNDLEANWSPDGKRLAFTTSRDGFQELYTMAADGSDLQRLTHNERQNDLRATFSPDGKWIAYMTNYSVGDGTGEIWLMDADGQHQRRLTDNQQDDREPVWSPDSRQIAFIRTQLDRQGTDIFVYDFASDHIRQLTESSGYEFQPAWSPDGTWIAFTSNPNGDGQRLIIEIVRADGSERHPLLVGTDDISSGRGFTWMK